MIVVNGRFLTRKMTGVERVASSVYRYLQLHDDVHIIVPRTRRPTLGHAWEQFVLPIRARGQILWSPANFGPLMLHRQLLTVYDASVWDHPEWFSRGYATWFRSVVPRVARAAALVMTVSEFSGARILAHLPFLQGKLTVIPLATEALYEESECPLPGGLKPRAFVLTVGSLEPRKNLHRLLEAWDIVHRSVRNARLVIVGGSHSAALKHVTASMLSRDSVSVLGHVSDPELVSLYRACLGFVFPSLYEGFGLPPVEAAAYGCRVVASRLPPLQDLLGDGPIYIDPLSTESLAGGLMSLLTDEAQGRVSGVPIRRWSDVAEDVYSALRNLGT